MSDARFLLDTSTIIHIRSRRTPALDRFAELEPGRAAMSVISYGELLFGVRRSVDPSVSLERLGQLTSRIPVETLPVEAAAEYAEIRSDLGRRGELIGPNDLWIAAHARSRGFTLVTGNEREFRRVPNLVVENWVMARA